MLNQGAIFFYVCRDDRFPKNHPLRKLRVLVVAVLESMDQEFETVYAETRRRSVPSERLLNAMLLQILFTSLSERLLVELIRGTLSYR